MATIKVACRTCVIFFFCVFNASARGSQRIVFSGCLPLRDHLDNNNYSKKRIKQKKKKYLTRT